MGKKVAKFVGIGMLCIVAVLGIGIGIFALTGGFDQKVIALTSLYFDEQSVETNGYVMNVQDVRTADEAALSIKKYIVISDDYTMSVGCLPTDATNTTLEITPYWVTAPIEIPEKVKAGQKFTIKVKKDANGNNLGGSAKLVFKSESGVTCELYVIVDVILENADIKLDVSGFSAISPSTATGSSLGGNNRYVLARKSGIANLTLESDLSNAFKINQSGISNKDFADNSAVKFFDKHVYIFTEQENVVSFEQKNGAPITYDITLNLEQVEGSNLTLYVRTHRTYEMQQEFESLGLNVFMDYYKDGIFEEDQIENTFNNQDFALNYAELIYKYNNFVNKYYDYIVEDRNSSEFFESLRSTTSGQIAFSESGTLFLSQVWKSLKYVFVNSDIDLFISDIDIKTMQVLADSPYIMEVFENKTLSLEELVSAFEIVLENDDKTVVVEEADKLALLSNMNVGIYVEGGADKAVTLEDQLKQLYNIATVQNGNGAQYDEVEKGVKINELNKNNKFVTLSRNGNQFNLEALVPSKFVKNNKFQIYIVFSIAITKSTGTTSIFYDFGKIDVTYEEEVSFEGGMPYSNINYIDEMCVNNNNAISEDTEAFNGAIGSQTIEVDMNRVLGANAKYLVPKFFVEKTSNEYSYEGTREYYEIDSRTSTKRVVGKDGEKDLVYTGLNIAGYPLREFVKMEGDLDEKYSYNDKTLQAYELPITHKFDETKKEADRNIYTIDVSAINALYDGSIKIFWACVLVDKDGNPIDRDGNRLFNDNGDAIENGDMGALLGNDKNVSYVVIYSSLDIASANYFQNIGINTISLLEEVNFYSQNSSSAYLYVEDGELKNVESKEYFLRNNRNSVDEAYTKLKLISREVYDDALVVSGFKLFSELIDGTAKLYPSFTAEELAEAKEKGIDLYGNIYKAMERALTEENFGFSSSENRYVVATFDNNKVAVAEDPEGGTEPIEPEEPEVAETFFWKIDLEAFDFDRTSEKTTCSLSLNTNCSLYELLDDCLVRMEVSAPKITNLYAINKDIDSNNQTLVGLTNFNKQIFVDGEFASQGNAGDVTWTYNFEGQENDEEFSFYLPGSYKVWFKISTENSNMELLEDYYEKEIDRVLNEAGLEEAEKAEYKDVTKPVFERVKKLMEKVDELNANGSTIQNFNPLIDNNIVDIIKNNKDYISTYLNGLIYNNINPEVFTGDLDAALIIIQNYGVPVEITKEDTLKTKLAKLKEALTKFNELTKNVITLEDINNLPTLEDGAEELLPEQLTSIQAVITKILAKSPTYDEDFVSVRTVLKSVYQYDLKDLVNKFEKVFNKDAEFFKDCTTSSQKILKIIGSENVHDSNGNSVIELKEIIDQVNSAIDSYNDSVKQSERLTYVEYTEVTENLNLYFEENKLLEDNEIVLNADGTIPFKTDFKDNLVLNVGLQFRFYPTSNPGNVAYKYVIEKEHSFYMNFKPVSLTLENPKENVTAGESLNLGQYITLEGITSNHVTLSIDYSYQDLVYFVENGQKVYSVKANSTTELYISDLVNDDGREIQIFVSTPYYRANGEQVSGYITIMVDHNVEVEFADVKFVSAKNIVKAQDVSSSDIGYYDLSNFVTFKEASSLTVSIENISNDRISLENNILKLAAYNISGQTVDLKITIKNGEEVVAAFTKTIEILPYYKVVFNIGKMSTSFENGQTYYLTTMLNNHFNIYDLDLIQVYEINTEDYSYSLLDKNKEQDLSLIKSVVGYEGIYALGNAIPEITTIPNVNVLGINLHNQFYTFDGETELYYKSYLGDKLRDWLNESGDVNIPEFSKSVVIPVSVSFKGYMGTAGVMNICLKIRGIEKYENIAGEGNVEQFEATFTKSPYESGTENYKQSFSELSLDANASYNLDEYIQLVLSELNNGEQNRILKISYELNNAIEGVSLTSVSSITVNESQVDINGILSIGEDVQDGTTIKLKLKVYEIVESGTSIIGEEIKFDDVVTIKVVNKNVEITE